MVYSLTSSFSCGSIAEAPRSEEHTSELQSRLHLVCRLLLEKKKTPGRGAAARPRSGPFDTGLRRSVCSGHSAFFFNDTATTEIYTLSLHDALPIYACANQHRYRSETDSNQIVQPDRCRSEEHTSELQSRLHLVCRLLLEKKKN